MKIVKVDEPVEINAGPAAAAPTEVAPDYVDQIDNHVASVVSPGGDTRTVALADLPAGVKEGHYVSGGQIVPAPADEGAPIRARLAAGDPGGTISLDGPSAAPAAASAGPTVMSPVGQIPAGTPGLPPVTDSTAPDIGGAPVAPGGPGPADAYIDSVINGTAGGAPGAPAGAAPTPGTPGAADGGPAIPKLGPNGLPADSSDLQQRILQGVDAEGKALQGISDAKAQGQDEIAKVQADRDELRRQQAADLAAQQLYERERTTKLDQEDAANLQKARDTTIPDFWEGREGGLVGGAITAGLAGLFGGALAGATGGAVPQNPVLQAIQHSIDTYSQKEKEKVDNLYKYAEQKGLMNDKLRSQYAGELTDLMQQHAYLMQAAADRIGEVSDQSKGLVDQAQTKYLQSQLQGNASELLIKARAIDEKNYDAQTHREIADADMVRANAAAAKAARRGAGGGGGTGSTDAAEQLAHAIRLGVDDGKGGKRPMTYDEQLSAAKQFGVPAEAKAGRVSLTSVLKGAAFDANQAAKEAKAGATGAGGAAGDRLLSKEANDWRKENGLDDIAKKQREIGAVMDEIKNAPHNPLQQALAVEKAVSSARGGAASRQALDLALHHLGGQGATIQGLIAGARTGEIGQKQMDNFIGFMSNQLGTAQKEGKDKYDDFNKWIASQPPAKQAALQAERGRLFSGLHGFAGQAAPAAAGGTRTVKPAKGKYAGKTVTVDADNNVLSVQ